MTFYNFIYTQCYPKYYFYFLDSWHNFNYILEAYLQSILISSLLNSFQGCPEAFCSNTSSKYGHRHFGNGVLMFSQYFIYLYGRLLRP